MTLYESFLEAVTTEYDTLRVLKQSPRGTVSVVRHKKSGTRYVFRRYSGSGEVYRRLLPVLCPHLPQIMEAADRTDRPPCWRNTCRATRSQSF